ncbi:MAG TPA: OmpA family protein [Aestuariivirgaceae bacterium]|nr:OmpA family protein [Aestuariivirgaceae bacterium]
MIGNHAYLGSAALAVALVLGGCVTQGTYDKLQEEKAQESRALQRQRAALEQQLQDLQSQLSALEGQRSSLQQQKTSLEQEKGTLEQTKAALEREQARLRAQNEALESQRSQLMSASQQSQAQYDALVADLNQELQKGELQVRRYKDMLTVDVAEQLFFDSGRAALKESGKEVLKKVAEAMKTYEDKAIRVVGHTDDVPIAKSWQKVFPSNWELSAARATTVVRFLQDSGIAPERLIATGRAEYAPVAPNDSAEGRQKNRRIEITLIDRNLLQESRTER